MEKQANAQKQATPPKKRPKYEPPTVVTYQKNEILKRMGPARGGSFNATDPDAVQDAIRRENWRRRRLYTIFEGHED